MKKPRICAAIVNNDLPATKQVEPLVDLFEVRIDLIGDSWRQTARQLGKPWIATNRLPEEGGKWQNGEARRVEALLEAIELGASIVDVELRTKNLERIVQAVKKRATCLISFHDVEKTPPLTELKQIVRKQVKAGADICKIVTTALRLEDNLITLQLVSENRDGRLVSFAMGSQGVLSRVLCPLAGAEFTYASLATGKESAAGQITVSELVRIYEVLQQ